jgi:hypothetical protein
MESDRELLVLAAKAAGYAEIEFLPDGDDRWVNVYDSDGKHAVWSPLEDDGDALRLAIDLGIDLLKPPVGNAAAWDDPDRYAKTRRAIVRAAAAIAREGKGE